MKGRGEAGTAGTPYRAATAGSLPKKQVAICARYPLGARIIIIGFGYYQMYKYIYIWINISFSYLHYDSYDYYWLIFKTIIIIVIPILYEYYYILDLWLWFLFLWSLLILWLVVLLSWSMFNKIYHELSLESLRMMSLATMITILIIRVNTRAAHGSGEP